MILSVLLILKSFSADKYSTYKSDKALYLHVNTVMYTLGQTSSWTVFTSHILHCSDSQNQQVFLVLILIFGVFPLLQKQTNVQMQ